MLSCCKLSRLTINPFVFLSIVALAGCNSERVRDEAELMDYLKSVQYEEQNHADETKGTTASTASATPTPESAPANQFFPTEEARRN